MDHLILKRMRESLVSNPYFWSLYDQADKHSAALTKHGRTHAQDVEQLGLSIVEKIALHYPDYFSKVEVEQIRLGCLGHDLGRSEPYDTVMENGHKKYVDRHEVHSARIMKDFLSEHQVPTRLHGPIIGSCIDHRANGCLGRNALKRPHVPRSKVLAVVVLADKGVGDAERVRGKVAWRIRIMQILRLCHYVFANSNEDIRNSMANYAIKKAEIVVDTNADYPTKEEVRRGAIILRLQLDERVCTMEHILTLVKWSREAYHCCGKAAKALGFVFRIDVFPVHRNFSPQRWYWSDETSKWECLSGIEIPM